ncbi:MAG TPA: hypothetical protein VGE27_08570 [Gemmatimonas sp.]
MTVTEHPRTTDTSVHRRALQAIVLGTVGIALAYASAFLPPPMARWGPYVMAVAMPLNMIATMVLGAARAGRSLGRLKWPMGAVFVLVAGAFLLALGMPADVADGALWLGLPPRAAVIVYGVGLLPLFVLPLAYAFTFDAFTLSDADVERVRAARLSPTARPADTQ